MLSHMNIVSHTTQNELILSNLKEFYISNKSYLEKMLSIITGETKMSLRIVDWFTTNYSKKYFTVYNLNGERFKVYTDYKLKLKAYSKKRFDPFCRWDRIQIPFTPDTYIETTIGQLNFFKWAIENKVLEYIEINYDAIESDMNSRNSANKRLDDIIVLPKDSDIVSKPVKNRKKRAELSISASKSIKKECIEIVVCFN
jgi:hypothetical protein